MDYTPEQLAELSNEELEVVFREDRHVSVPEGLYRGCVIRRLDNRGARLWLPRVLEFVGFEIAPFGIDFRHNRWYFASQRLQAGRFTPRVQPSRWRDTQVVALHYGVSRLPGFMRNYLYDEVKPLGNGVLLGLGGINRDLGIGDHFFFSLELVAGTGSSEVAT